MRNFRKFWIGLGALLLLFVGSAIFWFSTHAVVPILMYHEIDKKEVGGLNIVTPETFEKHLKFLQKNGFHVIRFEDLVSMLTMKKSVPSKSVVITFDDGYMDNFTYAFPLLKKYDFTGIVFIPTDLMNTEGYLTWDQIRLMDQNGIDFGSHSRRHKYLPEIDNNELNDEIVNSKKILENQLGHEINIFSYPIGGFTQEIQKIVKDSGYIAACTTNRGKSRFNQNVYELKRIRMNDRDVSDFILWAKLSGFYNIFRKSKPGHQSAANYDVKGIGHE